MTIPDVVHVVFIAYPFWGHTGPLCSLAAKLAQYRPIHITVLVTKDLLARVRDEISKHIATLGDENFIRTIALNAMSGFNLIHEFEEAVSPAYVALASCEPLRCAETGDMHPALPHPKLVVLDMLGFTIMQAVRRLSKVPTPVYAWESASATAVSRRRYPQKYEKLTAVIAPPTDEMRYDAEAHKHLWDSTNDAIVRLPGCPPMFEWEFFPQAMRINLPHDFMLNITRTLHQCDGVVLSTNEAVELAGIQEVKDWYAETSRPVFTICPYTAHIKDDVPDGTKSIDGERKEHLFLDFLGRMCSAFGENSVIYVSFGTVFWPQDPEILWAFLDVLIEMNIPFILSHAFPLAKIPDTFRERVRASGIGLLFSWSPQALILSHKATGWFVSHCGQNSMIESLFAGVPLICWPFAGDQPVNAAILSSTLDVAYELFEVRTGTNGLKPIHRLGPEASAPSGTVQGMQVEVHDMLGRMRGEDGARKRANAQKLSEEIARGWDTNGPCQMELDRLARTAINVVNDSNINP